MSVPQYDQHDRYRGSSRDTVPKLVVEEKEQEILAKEETISVRFHLLFVVSATENTCRCS